MSIKKRILQSFGATILGPAVTILIQLINIPILLRFWGPQLFGEWLLITTIPNYLLLSDLGFGNVAGNDMTIRMGAEDKEGAIETFQSTSILVWIISAAIGFLLTALILVLPLHSYLHLQAMSATETRMTLLILCINCLLILQWSVITAAYRCDGKYALGMLYVNCIRLLEGISFLVLLFYKAGPMQLALLMLTMSCIGTGWLLYQQKRLIPWLKYGTRCATRLRIKELWKPALAYMAFPVGVALSLQGTTLAVGLVLGPIAVATFNPMRTLARTVYQLADATKNAVLPELSSAYGGGDWELSRKLHRAACQAAFCLALFGCTVLAFAGHEVFRLWTHGRVQFESKTFHLLLLSLIFSAVWNASSAVPMSSNRHKRMAFVYLMCTSAGLLCCYVMLRWIGMPGAGFALVGSEMIMCFYVVHLSVRLLDENMRDFISQFLNFSYWKGKF